MTLFYLEIKIFDWVSLNYSDKDDENLLFTENIDNRIWTVSAAVVH